MQKTNLTEDSTGMDLTMSVVVANGGLGDKLLWFHCNHRMLAPRRQCLQYSFIQFAVCNQVIPFQLSAPQHFKVFTLKQRQVIPYPRSGRRRRYASLQTQDFHTAVIERYTGVDANMASCFLVLQIVVELLRFNQSPSHVPFTNTFTLSRSWLIVVASPDSTNFSKRVVNLRA